MELECECSGEERCVNECTERSLYVSFGSVCGGGGNRPRMAVNLPSEQMKALTWKLKNQQKKQLQETLKAVCIRMIDREILSDTESITAARREPADSHRVGDETSPNTRHLRTAAK